MHADSVTKSTLWRLRHERRLWLAPPFIFNNVNTAHTFPSKPGVTGVEVIIFQIQQRLRSHICTQRQKKKKKKQDKSKQTLTMRSVPCYSGTQKSSSREAAPPCFTHTYTHSCYSKATAFEPCMSSDSVFSWMSVQNTVNSSYCVGSLLI